jgi:hypothetical protein
LKIRSVSISEPVIRLPVEQKRNGIKERERNHGQQRAAGEPLQLLAQQGRVGAVVTDQEQNGRQNVEDGIVAGGDLFQAVLEQPCSLPVGKGPDPQAEQGRAGRINQRQKPAAAQLFQSFLGKAESKVQK